MDEYSFVPPVCNTGVQNTCRGGLDAVVDWFQVTFKIVHDGESIIDLLGIDRTLFQYSDRGMYGWTGVWETAEGEIRIFEGGISGTHLLMSGNGCRFFEKYSSITWKDFFCLVQNTDINVKRLDIAIDDYFGYYTPLKLYRKIKEGAVISRFRRGRWIENFDIGDYKKRGTTIYIGSPQSSIQLRVYDKLRERTDKGYVVNNDVKCWIRTEIQLRDERAELAMLVIAYDSKSFGELASGILSNYVRFVVKDKNNKNKSRWKTAKWWSDFLGDVSKVSLTMKYEEPVLEKTINWAVKQWGTAIYSIREVFGTEDDFIRYILNKAEKKVKDDRKAMARIQKFKEKYGHVDFLEYVNEKEKRIISK